MKTKVNNSSYNTSNEVLSYTTTSGTLSTTTSGSYFWENGVSKNNLDLGSISVSKDNLDLGSISDEELKNSISKKINLILDEDTTIQIMKDYLLKFIDKNIDNPENLIKEVLIRKDEELNECKKEIEQLKKELNDIRNLLFYIPTNTNPYPFYPTSGPIGPLVTY